MTSLFSKPVCPPSPWTKGKMGMRDYQRRAVASIGRCLAESGSTLLVMPTGTGKTVTFAHAIKQHCPPGKRALVLAHRQELIEQNAKTIGAVLGEPCAVEMADMHADVGPRKAKVIVASKDSLHPSRLARFDPAEFGLVITDEAHHSIAGTYTRVYKHFAGVPHLGVTATPDRLDEAALGQVFASVAMDYEIADAIHDGWLVPVRAHTVFVKDMWLDKARTVAGDFNQGDLAAIMERDRVMHEVATAVTEEAGQRRAIIFTVSVRQAQMLAEVLNGYVADSARWVCGETPKEQRTFDLAEHRAGAFRFMVNVGVLTEGYDDPTCGMIVMARPTKSRALFAQCLGRGTRPLPGLVDGLSTPEARRAAIAASAKPHLKVLDFTGNCGKHDLVSPADVLGGKYPDEDIEAASGIIAEEECDVSEALEQARRRREEASSEVQEEIRNVREARARIVALSKYVLREEDLFDSSIVVGRERNWSVGKPATDPQIETLERAGFSRADVETMSRSECSRLIGEIVTRRMRGLATLKQTRLLGRWGIDATAMPFEEARQHLDRLIGSRKP